MTPSSTTFHPVLPNAGLARDVHALLAGLGAGRPGSLRVGADVTSVAWFSRLLTRRAGQAMTRRAFTPAEQEYCAGRPERYAVRWAAKEAVAKAVGTGFRGLRPADIEIGRLPDGRPVVTAADGAAWPDGAHTWPWALSLCHENDAALAIAIATPPRAAALATSDRRSHGH
jgi:holo-[acyl-carrier protein] synthase